ncbi:MAG: hypothetical protein IPH53_05555 [Flavobacteriales bacterium]|nr:hypothetical protein [Flavobacteriales bacterium]
MPQRVRSSSPRSASLIVALVIATGTLAQNIGINADGAAAHASALLDVSVAALPANAKKGLLVPRMTTAQRNAIPTPAEALLVYDTSLNQFWYYDGVQWAAIANLGTYGAPRATWAPWSSIPSAPRPAAPPWNSG